MIKKPRLIDLPRKPDDPFAYGNPPDKDISDWIDDRGAYDHADPYDPSGSFYAWRLFMKEDADSFQANANMQKTMCETYKRIALSPLLENPIVAHVYALDPKNKYEKAVARSIGFENVLFLEYKGKTIAIFDEKSTCFLPSSLSLEKDEELEELLRDTACAKRYVFYLETAWKAIHLDMRKNFSLLVESEKTRYGIDKVEENDYYQEKIHSFNNETDFFLKNHAKKSLILALAGFPGRQEDDVFVETPLVALVSKDSPTPMDCHRLSDTAILLPPVKKEFEKISYHAKQDRMEVEVICGNKHCKHIYNIHHLPEAKEIDYVVDLNNQVPSYALKQFYYAIPHSGAETGIQFRLLPEETEERLFLWEGKNAEKTWTLVQRHSKAERIEARKGNATLATLHVPKGSPRPQSHARIVSLDIGGMTSTMLMDNGTDQPTGVVYDKIAMPLTPARQEAFASFAKGALERDVSSSKDISWQSMLQYNSIADGKESQGTLICHSWEPGQATLLSTVQSYTGADYTIANGMGIYYDLKLPLTIATETDRDGEKENVQQNRYASYIASILRPILLASLREGYKPGKNLFFLIAYPDTGEESRQCKAFKKSINMAISLLNKQLADNSQLTIGTNCFLFSEASATAKYLLVNNDILNPEIACLFLDIGHTTIDIDIRKRNKNLTMSVPYAGNEITFRSLIAVLSQNLDETFPLDCFQEKEAKEILERVKHSLKECSSDKARLNNVGARLLLSHAFQQYRFSLPATLTPAQKLFRLATQQRIRCTLPCYAGMIAKALQEGIMDADDNLKFVLAGNGSRAFANTGDSFSGRFFEDLVKLVNKLAGNEIPQGAIELIPNIDTRKESVARGMLYMHGEHSKLTIENKNHALDASYFLKLLYGDNTPMYKKELAKFHADIQNAPDYRKQEKEQEIRSLAYKKVFEDYSFADDFEPCFQEYLRLPQDDGDMETSSWNDAILSLAREKTTFENEKNIAMQNKRSLIMCFPEIHKLMITACIVNELIDKAIKGKEIHHDS